MKNDKTKEIIYIGDVGKPNTALSIHAQNMARLFGNLGYHTTFICDDYEGMNKISDETDLFNYCYTSKFITIPKISTIEWLIDELTGWKYRKIWRIMYTITIGYIQPMLRKLIGLHKNIVMGI